MEMTLETQKIYQCSSMRNVGILKSEAVVRRCSVKKVFLEISQNSKENTCARVSFLIKFASHRSATLLKKETLTQVFSCKFCEISKDNFSYRIPPVAASIKQPLMVESLLEILTKRRNQVLYKSLDVHSMTNAIGKSISSISIWNIVNQFR